MEEVKRKIKSDREKEIKRERKKGNVALFLTFIQDQHRKYLFVLEQQGQVSPYRF
jgi:hypothetical protein